MSDSQVPLHVETAGLEPAPGVETFLLIHGYGASTFSWRFWAPRLAQRGHVVMLDMKGFGRSPKPADGRYGPADQEELVTRLIRARDLRELTVVGHSLGGGVTLLTALRLLAEEPERLKRIVVVAGAAYDQKLPPFVRLADRPRLSARLFRLLGPSRVVRAVIKQIVHDPSRVDDEQVRGYAEPLESADAVDALIAAARQIVPEDLDVLASRYPTIGVPALLLWGRVDPVVPLAVGERLARALPNARLRIFDACGHIPAEELPDASYEVLEAFLDGQPLPGSA